MRWRLGSVLAVALLSASVAQGQLPGSPFTVDLPGEMGIAPGTSAAAHLFIRVPERHYLYREKTTLEFVTLEGLRIEAIRYPPFERRFDPFFQKTTEVYDTDVDIAVTLAAPAGLQLGPRELQALLTYQGCSEKLCYRFEERTVRWAVTVGAPVGAISSVPSATYEVREERPPRGWRDLLSVPDFGTILAHGVGLAYLLTFLGGLLTAFTPCVLPLLPVILLIIGIHPGAHRRNFLLALALTCGLAITYAVIGMTGALAGVPLSFLFQQRWFLWLVVAFYCAMALSMFGLFSLRLPQWAQQRLQRLGGKGYRGAFLAGVSTGLLATPCAGPVIGALVAYVGTKHDLSLGFSLLLTYGLGFGLVFLLLGTCFGSLTQHIKRPIVARVVKISLGIFLLLPAGYYVWALTGGSRWQASEAAAIAQARALNRPLLIEFGAKTCPPCLVLERTTLKDTRVVRALAEEVVPLKIDATFGTPEVERLLERYRVVGWPTILFVSPAGDVYWDLALTGEIPSPETLLERISQARRRVTEPGH